LQSRRRSPPRRGLTPSVRQRFRRPGSSRLRKSLLLRKLRLSELLRPRPKPRASRRRSKQGERLPLEMPRLRRSEQLLSRRRRSRPGRRRRDFLRSGRSRRRRNRRGERELRDSESKRLRDKRTLGSPPRRLPKTLQLLTPPLLRLVRCLRTATVTNRFASLSPSAVKRLRSARSTQRTCASTSAWTTLSSDR